MNKQILLYLAGLLFIISNTPVNAETLPPKNTEAGVIDKANELLIQKNQTDKAKVNEEQVIAVPANNGETPIVLHTIKFT